MLLSFPHYLHNYHKAFTYILAADTNTSRLFFFLTISLLLSNYFLGKKNGGFPSKSQRGARNNPTFVLRGVHLVVIEISHLPCDPGVNSERWPLVTCEAFSKHYKHQQELPVCSILNRNVEQD